ncbi:MAG: helix-turn-helix transcriptional regulator [Marmoricola sp.]
MRTSGRREQVLALLRESPEPRSILEVADPLGVHANTARFHLEALHRAGRIEKVTPASSGPGRPPLLFRARRAMDPAGPRNYELLAGVLLSAIASDPQASRRAVESGRDWGRRLAGEVPAGGDTTDRLVHLLDTLGFAPERRRTDDGAQIGLRHCPFLELAGPRTDVVCPVHLGLMQGAAEAMGGGVAVASLEPFVAPDLCVTHLGTP